MESAFVGILDDVVCHAAEGVGGVLRDHLDILVGKGDALMIGLTLRGVVTDEQASCVGCKAEFSDIEAGFEGHGRESDWCTGEIDLWTTAMLNLGNLVNGHPALSEKCSGI